LLDLLEIPVTLFDTFVLVVALLVLLVVPVALVNIAVPVLPLIGRKPDGVGTTTEIVVVLYVVGLTV